MLYSDIEKYGFLPKKEKYTIADVKKAQIDSLFKPYEGRTLTRIEAKFLVRCSATYHNTEYSKECESCGLDLILDSSK